MDPAMLRDVHIIRISTFVPAPENFQAAGIEYGKAVHSSLPHLGH